MSDPTATNRPIAAVAENSVPECEAVDASYAVVIPCRNAQAWIGLCIASCLRQLPLPREIIVVDDGSTDESVRAASEVELPPGVTLRMQRAEGVGAALARETGAQLATSSWLLFLDADDELEPDAVAKLLACASASDVVYGDAVLTDASGAAISFRSLRPATEHAIAGIFFNAPLCGTALVRRAARLPWQAGYDAVDEFHFFARLAVFGRGFRHVEAPVLRYRQHPTPARKSNVGMDYGTALAIAFADLWHECVTLHRDDDALKAYMSWIMSDLAIRAVDSVARSRAARHARALRPFRWRKLAFALRHYGARRLARMLLRAPGR